jgi:Spy/CpxP family protein refolding chaperone
MALLGLGAATLLAGLALAQRPQFGGGMGMGGNLLNNESVQKELKLSKDQVDKIKGVEKQLEPKRAEVRKKMADLGDVGFQERMEKARELNKPIQDEETKALAGILTPEQEKRFKQVEVYVRGLFAFADTKVQEALKLTDDQKEQIKTISGDTFKDQQELRKEAGRDREKQAEVQKKIAAMNKETMGKIVALFNDEQKKTWKELVGEAFEYRPTPFGGFGGGRGKGKDKDK